MGPHALFEARGEGSGERDLQASTICQTIVRLPRWSGVVSAHTLPERPAVKKLVLGSSVVVPAPGGRSSIVAATPTVSASAIKVPPVEGTARRSELVRDDELGHDSLWARLHELDPQKLRKGSLELLCDEGRAGFSMPPWWSFARRDSITSEVMFLRWRTVLNWEATAASLIQWLHRDAVSGFGDAETRGLLEELVSYPDVPRHWRSLDLDASTAPFLPIEFRKGELALRYFTTLTSLGTPHDITLQELRVESFFPADEATEELSRRLATGR